MKSNLKTDIDFCDEFQGHLLQEKLIPDFNSEEFFFAGQLLDFYIEYPAFTTINNL